MNHKLNKLIKSKLTGKITLIDNDWVRVYRANKYPSDADFLTAPHNRLKYGTIGWPRISVRTEDEQAVEEYFQTHYRPTGGFIPGPIDIIGMFDEVFQRNEPRRYEP